MFDPLLTDQEEGKGYAWLDEEGPQVVDAGTLRVMPITTVELSIVDNRGVPAAGVSGYVTPLMFDNPRLLPPVLIEEYDFLIDDIPVEGDDRGTPGDFIEWPYEGFWFTTYSEGKSTLRLAPGRWELGIDGMGSYYEEDAELPILEFNTNVGELVYQLPFALGQAGGRLVNDQGQPVPYADLVLMRESDGDMVNDAYSDSDGTFAFSNLKLDEKYILRATPSRQDEKTYFIARDWVFDTESGFDKDYVVAAAASVTVTVSRTGGPPLEEVMGILKVTDWQGTNGAVVDVDSAWWAAARKWQDRALSRRPVYLPSMPPGIATLQLMVPTGIGEWDLHGQPKVKLMPIKSWPIEIKEGRLKLDVDLSSYLAPETNQTQHRGKVVDAVTGEPVEGAILAFNFVGGSVNTNTDDNGRITFQTIAQRGDLNVYSYGYLPYKKEQITFRPGPHEHHIQLQQASSSFELLVRDSAGAQAPVCEIELFDTAGNRIPVNMVEAYSYRKLTAPLWAHDGRVTVSDIPAGRARALVTFEFDAVATGWIDIPTNPSGTIEIVIDRAMADIIAELDS